MNLYNAMKLLFMVKKSKKLHKIPRASISCTKVNEHNPLFFEGRGVERNLINLCIKSISQLLYHTEITKKPMVFLKLREG